MEILQKEKKNYQILSHTKDFLEEGIFNLSGRTFSSVKNLKKNF